jgi:hypothetical protein
MLLMPLESIVSRTNSGIESVVLISPPRFHDCTAHNGTVFSEDIFCWAARWMTVTAFQKIELEENAQIIASNSDGRADNLGRPMRVSNLLIAEV